MGGAGARPAADRAPSSTSSSSTRRRTSTWPALAGAGGPPGAFAHLAWGEAELRFARQINEHEYGLRASLASLYRVLRDGGGAAGEELEAVLRGDAQRPRSPALAGAAAGRPARSWASSASTRSVAPCPCSTPSARRWSARQPTGPSRATTRGRRAIPESADSAAPREPLARRRAATARAPARTVRRPPPAKERKARRRQPSRHRGPRASVRRPEARARAHGKAGAAGERQGRRAGGDAHPGGRGQRPRPSAPPPRLDALSASEGRLLGDLFAIVEEHAARDARGAIDRDARGRPRSSSPASTTPTSAASRARTSSPIPVGVATHLRRAAAGHRRPVRGAAARHRRGHVGFAGRGARRVRGQGGRRSWTASPS